MTLFFLLYFFSPIRTKLVLLELFCLKKTYLKSNIIKKGNRKHKTYLPHVKGFLEILPDDAVEVARVVQRLLCITQRDLRSLKLSNIKIRSLWEKLLYEYGSSALSSSREKKQILYLKSNSDWLRQAIKYISPRGNYSFFTLIWFKLATDRLHNIQPLKNLHQ